MTFFCLLALSACGRINVEEIKKGRPYVGTWEDKNCVVVLENATEEDLSGRLYLDEGKAIAEPVFFTVHLKKKGKGVLQANAQEKTLKISVKNGVLEGKAADFPFNLTLQRDDSGQFNPLYQRKCYDVITEKVTEYAHADGYWTGYPDEDKSFAEIYLRRLPDLSKKVNQSLYMHIYQAEDSSTRLRPLVLMIHGGAFYNGDMQDETYVKWCRHYASLGYVAVSLNYRMGWLPYRDAIDRAGYRATQDAHAALRYLLHHAKEYRINPDWVFTWGTSAGTITALNVAFMNDRNRPMSVMAEGDVDKLAPDCSETFRVRAVANMWGAVHDTAILANSPTTTVISFHGDADGIVPYGYGVPFKEMISSSLKMKVNDHLHNIISLINTPSDKINNLLNRSLSMLNPMTEQIVEWTEPLTAPAWDFIVSPMYGSACIHKYLSRHGVRNKLFTVTGASQHSLHVDDHRNIVPYFYTIQDSVAQFFYSEIVPNPVYLLQENLLSPCFYINNMDVAEVHWCVDGGAVLEQSDNCAKVLFFKDADRHVVRVCGKYKNGVEFCEETDFCENKVSMLNSPSNPVYTFY